MLHVHVCLVYLSSSVEVDSITQSYRQSCRQRDRQTSKQASRQTDISGIAFQYALYRCYTPGMHERGYVPNVFPPSRPLCCQLNCQPLSNEPFFFPARLPFRPPSFLRCLGKLVWMIHDWQTRAGPTTHTRSFWKYFLLADSRWVNTRRLLLHRPLSCIMYRLWIQ